ncbi:MAG: exodeoxyribonuclease III [Hydrococcus sp. C42_A2020_068]|uniref:exodeoxyribonuclease III n=1 Tax=Pleurocapsa sp. PCC 7327 TaxID=118163 RepID=UPI00029F9EB3|nr:exodeoxyribonuclease III [Pleurocapsa sp. PCC 7327]AFY78248.1 exodeoxyribonuclease III [Pleurocapsa sp. PCC 7327]MBF2020051.1 exodeoxyribonuclease III [Hydrococcus sp. C42_A2020_068]
MKIATWNVNSIRTRQQHVVDWLQNNPVDVLCLQETKVTDADFPRDCFEKLGYHLYISGQKSYNGVAIFSLQPLTQISTGFAPVLGDLLAEDLDFDSQKRVITGVIGEIRIVNLYVPNGAAVDSEKYDYKLRWLKVLKDYLKTLREKSSEELCVCGDFNIALEDRDIYDPKGKENHIMASPRERQALQKVLAIGLKDAFRKFTAEGGHFSWWDYRQGGFQRNRGWRIDHHYLTPQLYERAISCRIDVEPRKLPQPSDHAPVIVEF